MSATSFSPTEPPPPPGGPLPLHVEDSGPPPSSALDTEGAHASHARSSEDEDAETFLLIHGYAGSTFTWRHWAPRLAARGRVVQIDLKGFGRAPKPDDRRYAPLDQAELVRALIERLDLRNLTLVGHSLGGGVALLTALGLRDGETLRLRRLVLVAGAAYAQRLPPFVAMADYPRFSSLVFRTLGAELVVSAVLRAIVYDTASVDAAQVRGYSGPLSSLEAVRALCVAAQQIVPPDLDRLSARYPELAVPTLLLWGRHDRVVPLWVGERLARELPDARLHVLERCGHLPPEELPDESFAALERFLER